MKSVFLAILAGLVLVSCDSASSDNEQENNPDTRSYSVFGMNSNGQPLFDGTLSLEYVPNSPDSESPWAYTLIGELNLANPGESPLSEMHFGTKIAAGVVIDKSRCDFVCDDEISLAWVVEPDEVNFVILANYLTELPGDFSGTLQLLTRTSPTFWSVDYGSIVATLLN